MYVTSRRKQKYDSSRFSILVFVFSLINLYFFWIRRSSLQMTSGQVCPPT